MVHLCFVRREMNDSMDVKRHIYLRTIAKQKLNSTWRLFHRRQQQHANTRFECIGMQPLVQAQQWFGVALAPTIWGGRVKSGRTP